MDKLTVKEEESIDLNVNDDIKVHIFKSKEGYVIDVWSLREGGGEPINTMTVWNDDIIEEEETEEEKKERVRTELSLIEAYLLCIYGEKEKLLFNIKSDLGAFNEKFNNLLNFLYKERKISEDVAYNIIWDNEDDSIYMEAFEVKVYL